MSATMRTTLDYSRVEAFLGLGGLGLGGLGLDRAAVGLHHSLEYAEAGMSQSVGAELRSFFEPHNRRLRRWLDETRPLHEADPCAEHALLEPWLCNGTNDGGE